MSVAVATKSFTTRMSSVAPVSASLAPASPPPSMPASPVPAVVPPVKPSRLVVRRHASRLVSAMRIASRRILEWYPLRAEADHDRGRRTEDRCGFVLVQPAPADAEIEPPERCARFELRIEKGIARFEEDARAKRSCDGEVRRRI